MRLSKPRIPPIPEHEWNEEQQEIFKNQRMRGNVLNIFRTLANHQKLAKRWLVFGNHVLAKSTLPVRDREIAILRVAWRCQSAYEWGQHVLIGQQAGLTPEEIERVKTGAQTDGWTDHERLVMTAVDELKDDAFVSDETWAGLKRTYTDQQMMDLVFACGQYNMVAMALNSFGVQLDPDINGF